MKSKIKRFVRRVLGFYDNSPVSMENFLYDWRLRIGPLIYKKKYTAHDIVQLMKKRGMQEGSVVFIQSRWAEFYNCISTPTELVEEILKVIGPTGTLAMDCEPYKKDGKIYNVKRTPTTMGLLAEAFRRYPGVVRSRNQRHSVCAIGAQSEYLVSEHHLGETAWDEKSPYFRLAELKGFLFCMGLGDYYQGTIQHCVESLLKNEIPYYHDIFKTEKTEYHYIDYDGIQKSYWNYDLAQPRTSSYRLTRKISKKYLKGKTSQISNLHIVSFETKEMLETMLKLARKGIDTYYQPSKKNYKFEN